MRENCVETSLPKSACCECGAETDAASGLGRPSEGDFTLCAYCGGLNVFDAHLRLRSPNDEEIFAAAKDSHLQRLRREIVSSSGAKESKARRNA